jgi:hypothetical protein
VDAYFTIDGLIVSGYAVLPIPIPPDHTDTTLESQFNHLPSSLRAICGSVVFPNDQGSALADACQQKGNILFGASDASYNHGQATHAWVMSSGNVSDLTSGNLSISGSGYVDGYAPHMSSARGELQGITALSIMSALFYQHFKLQEKLTAICDNQGMVP